MQKDNIEKPATMMVEDIDDSLDKPQIKKDYSGVAEKTDPAEIALVKKLDRWIMPMLWSMYWLNYLDRNAIALARLNDLEEDLNLTGTQYLTCVSILFVGYLLGQIPSKYVSCTLKLYGCVLQFASPRFGCRLVLQLCQERAR